MNYYVALNGSQAGPFTESQVREKIAAGEITGETLIWREGMVDWLPLGKALPSLLADSPAGKSIPVLSPAGSGWVLASLGSRLLAAVIDMIPLVLAVLILGMVMTVTGAGDFEDLPKATQYYLMGFMGGGFVLIGVVQIYLLVRFSQTIGKRICKIRIYNIQTGLPADWVRTIILRIFVNGIAGGIPCLGGLYSLVDICFIFRTDRRCIHDHIAGTVVGTVPGE